MNYTRPDIVAGYAGSRALEKGYSAVIECAALHASLCKVRILAGVAASALLGALVVSGEPQLSWALFYLLVGTAFSYAGAAAWNQVLEVRYDKQMERTIERPLPSGRLTRRYAALIGAALALSGGAILYFLVDPFTGVLSAAAFVLYVFLYTPLKRIGWYGTLVGTIPGAIPAVGGAVSSGHVSLLPTIFLFLLMVFWQLPHFYSYLWEVKEDYERAGFQMLPYARPDGLFLMKALVMFGSVGTLICTWVLSYMSPTFGLAQGAASTIGAFVLLYSTTRFVLEPNATTSRRLFRCSLYFIGFFTCIASLSLL